MSKLIIEGGIPLKGELVVAGSREAALIMIAAALLSKEEIVIQNAPKVSSVDIMLEVLQFLGAEASFTAKNEITIKAGEIKIKALSSVFVDKCPLVIFLFSALLARFNEAVTPINEDVLILEKLLSQKITKEDGFYQAKGDLKGATISIEQNNYTATANLIIAASLARGKTILQNAAEEPEIDSLIEMLNSMGANISRIKPQVVEIEGVKKLTGTKIFVMPDRGEAGILAIVAAATKGDILIKGVKSKEMSSLLKKLETVGVSFSALAEGIRVWAEEGVVLAPIDIEERSHPGFIAEWVSSFAILLTQVDGESVIRKVTDKNKFSFLPELKKMNAEIEYLVLDNKSAIKIFGPTPLVGTQLDILDLDAGITFLVAALTAKGTSEISGVEHIKQGYENLVEKLKKLGAKIEEIE